MNRVIICFDVLPSILTFICLRYMLMCFENGDTRDIAAEYSKAYPNEEEQYKRVKQEEFMYKMGQFARSNNMYNYFDNENLFSDACLSKRWGIVMSEEGKRLTKFLSSPRQMGDIFRRKVFPQYSTTFYQILKNTTTIDHVNERTLCPLDMWIYHHYCGQFIVRKNVGNPCIIMDMKRLLLLL